ncbi:Neurotrypsin, partial [Geodia barretti]
GSLFRESDFAFLLDGLVPIRRTNVVCAGNEDSLSECSFNGADGDPTCTHRDDVIIMCATQSECNEGDVRLVDGQTSTDGRVEVCLEGFWGSVCDDRWDSRDAQVVCRQLNFNGRKFLLSGASSYPLLNFGANQSSTIHLDDVHCIGSEERITDCSHSGIGINNCRAGTEEAGVICTNTTCEDGTVHLVGGDDVSRGRVEYCYQGAWYSVCASDWDDSGLEAQVICGNLGYRLESTVVNYRRGNSPILPFSISCSIGDSELDDCAKTALDTSQCPHVAGVNCEGKNVETEDESEKTCFSKTHVVAISIGSTLVGCVLASTTTAVVFVVVGLCRRHKTSIKSSFPIEVATLQTRNSAVYDEVVLPPANPSSIIPTEPNTAYVTNTVSQTRPITTEPNVAYAVHSSQHMAFQLEFNIKRTLADITKNCSCGFRASQIDHGEVSCRSIADGHVSTELLEVMKDWMANDGTFLYTYHGNMRLGLDQDCPLEIASFSQPEFRNNHFKTEMRIEL